MKKCIFIFVVALVILSCKKSKSDPGSLVSSSNNGSPQPGGASSNHMAAGTDCNEQTSTSNISFSGYTFYVDSGYVETGDGIVAAISGSPQITFSDNSYLVVQDSTDYFPSYLSGSNTYHVIGDTLEFNDYTKYVIKAYILCQKTLVYDMTEYGYNGLYNRLVLYRNL